VTPCEAILTPCMCGDLACEIPYGFCHCGCGGRVPLASRTNPRRRQIKGKPTHYLLGHRGKPVVIEDAQPFKIEGIYCCLIPLTRGQYAIVDADRYSDLGRYRWIATWSECTKSYYATRLITVSGRSRMIIMHRLILGLEFGDKREGDHQNGVTLDNRDKNLRIASRSQNQMNKRMQRNNSSGFTGVSRDGHGRDKWQASISISGKLKFLGYYDTAELAYDAYCMAAREHFGDFAYIKRENVASSSFNESRNV
jgi:hypothetical protein